MKTFTIICSLLLSAFKPFGQIPNIKHNFTHQDSIESKVIMSFARKFEFLMAYTGLSYWNGYKKEYQLLSYSKNKWETWTYSNYHGAGTKKRWSTKRKGDNKRNGKFVKTTRTPTTTDVSVLLKELNNNNFWSLDNDSLNNIYYTYLIDENTGDTLDKRQPHIIADGTTSRFEIFTKGNIKVIQAYLPDPDILERKVFVADLNIFLKWWDKHCR